MEDEIQNACNKNKNKNSIDIPGLYGKELIVTDGAVRHRFKIIGTLVFACTVGTGYSKLIESVSQTLNVKGTQKEKKSENMFLKNKVTKIKCLISINIAKRDK